MKLTFIILTAAISFAACNSTDKKTGENTVNTSDTAKLTPDQIAKAGADTANFTTIQWLDSTTRDLGKLKANQEVEVTFRFKNSGDKVLVVESVSASCGCTVPEKPEKPIPPGEEGVIKAKFNGSGHGVISKNVNVIANTNPQKNHTLTFTGDVQD
ncbi:MAG: DUF1573 domain-containing protein [Bacteroidetes bacterium]|nr:DUF1573 domain-containing protein [Bacteroidota bacterium]